MYITLGHTHVHIRTEYEVSMFKHVARRSVHRCWSPCPYRWQLCTTDKSWLHTLVWNEREILIGGIYTCSDIMSFQANELFRDFYYRFFTCYTTSETVKQSDWFHCTLVILKMEPLGYLVNSKIFSPQTFPFSYILLYFLFWGTPNWRHINYSAILQLTVF